MSGGLVWAPDPREARQVRARWVGAPALHTIYWGDGSSDRVLPWQGARHHVYAEPGRYEATAVAATAATAATVVVRPSTEVSVRAELAAPNRVRLTLPDLLEPDWLIEWGDGTATRHANTTAEHTYPWGHGLTRITVTDRPGRRRARLTGPTIGAEPEPDPEPEPDAGLLRDGFWWEHVGGRDGVLHGGGITPCSEVDIWWSAGASGSGHQVVTADRHGRVAVPRNMPAPVSSEFDVWRSTRVRYTSFEGCERVRYVPVHVPRAQRGQRDVVYDWDDTHPRRVYATVTGPPLAGVYRIDWGDGSPADEVDATRWPLRVPHTYTGDGPYTITATTPGGQQLTQRVQATYVCAISYNANYPGYVTALWTGGGCTSSSGYAPVRIASSDHEPLQYHCPDTRTGWQVVYGFHFATTGRKRFRQVTALGAERVTDVEVTAVARQVPDDDGQPHRLPEALPVPRFHVGALNDGWYDGWFEVRNPHDEPAPFGLVFELAAPAVLAEVDSWGGTASAHPLGPGRWRIDHDRPVPPRGSVRVGITVRPCGDPRRWPTNVQVVQ